MCHRDACRAHRKNDMKTSAVKSSKNTAEVNDKQWVRAATFTLEGLNVKVGG